MKNELYTENFFNKEKSNQILMESKDSSKEEKPLEIYDLTLQMFFYLDQLEKEIIEDYKDFTDFNFIFDRIRKKIKAKNTEGVLELLANLEELLEVDQLRLRKIF